MAKSDTWMAFYVGDYLSDTLHLAREHHGSYLLLILAAFKNEGWLPGDDASLALIAKCTVKQWKAERHIYARFFAVGNDRWTHNRVTRELEKSTEITAKRQRAGLASAAKRQQAVNTCSTHVDNVFEQTGIPSQSPSQEQTKAKALGAKAPARDVLYAEGLPWLIRKTGKSRDACARMIGQWLRDEHDNAEVVLAAVQLAEETDAADPFPFVKARLPSHTTKPRETWNQRRIREGMEAIRDDRH
jgi:uncharacterized protein YdaU (DUF1376 family)